MGEGGRGGLCLGWGLRRGGEGREGPLLSTPLQDRRPRRSGAWRPGREGVRGTWAADGRRRAAAGACGRRRCRPRSPGAHASRVMVFHYRATEVARPLARRAPRPLTNHRHARLSCTLDTPAHPRPTPEAPLRSPRTRSAAEDHPGARGEAAHPIRRGAEEGSSTGRYAGSRIVLPDSLNAASPSRPPARPSCAPPPRPWWNPSRP